jgi:DNA-binding NarL/FixJ family response regulator
MTENCKILILGNFSLYRAGLRTILEREPCFEIIGETANPDDLIHIRSVMKPDVIVLDIINTSQYGIQLIKQVNRIMGNIPVLLITSTDYACCFNDYIRLGVRGIILSNAMPSELNKAVRKLFSGGEHFPTKALKIYKETIDLYHKAKEAHKRNKELTAREVHVLKYLSLGLSLKEIGTRLYISPRTVETHKRNIMSKLHLQSTADLIKYHLLHEIAGNQ